MRGFFEADVEHVPMRRLITRWVSRSLGRRLVLGGCYWVYRTGTEYARVSTVGAGVCGPRLSPESIANDVCCFCVIR